MFDVVKRTDRPNDFRWFDYAPTQSRKIFFSIFPEICIKLQTFSLHRVPEDAMDLMSESPEPCLFLVIQVSNILCGAQAANVHENYNQFWVYRLSEENSFYVLNIVL